MCEVVEVKCTNEQEPHRRTLNPVPDRRPFRHPPKKPLLIATRFLLRKVLEKLTAWRTSKVLYANTGINNKS